MKAYMSFFYKRKNAHVNIKEVTIKEVDGVYYHVEFFGDILIGELEKTIEEDNGKIYIYSTDIDRLQALSGDYIKSL